MEYSCLRERQREETIDKPVGSQIYLEGCERSIVYCSLSTEESKSCSVRQVVIKRNEIVNQLPATILRVVRQSYHINYTPKESGPLTR